MTDISTAVFADRIISTGERFWYVVLNVLTFAAAYFAKIVVKKAVLEALIAHDQYVIQASPPPEPHMPTV